MTDLSALVVVIILMNCYPESEIFVLQRKYSGEIYATSIDYNPNAEESVLFFKQVQNKMHWAAHKHTAAEIIFSRADSEKDNMGLTSWEGKQIKKSDSELLRII